VGVAHADGLKLFGQAVKGASRQDVRAALVKAGLGKKRVDSRYFCDEYSVHGQITGAKDLLVCYTAHDHFAYAQYTFPSFLDTEQVTRVAALVSSKYGKPTSVDGRADLGDVTEVWSMHDGTEVVVARGWPSTTTYLTLKDPRATRALEATIEAQKAEERKQQAKQQGNAF
jgi:hypothetical protein